MITLKLIGFTFLFVSPFEEVQISPHRICLRLLIHVTYCLPVPLWVHLEQRLIHIVLLEVPLVVLLELVLHLLVLLLQHVLLPLESLDLRPHCPKFLLLLQLLLLDRLRLPLAVDQLLLETDYPLQSALPVLLRAPVDEGLTRDLDDGALDLGLLELRVLERVLERALLRGLDVEAHVLLGELLVLELRVVDLLQDLRHVGLRVVEYTLFLQEVQVQVLVLEGDVTEFGVTLADLTDHVIGGNWVASVNMRDFFFLRAKTQNLTFIFLHLLTQLSNH